MKVEQLEDRTTPSLLTDSVVDFSGTQGAKNWYYGYYDQASDSNGQYEASDFQQMPQYGVNDPNHGPIWSVEDGKYWTAIYAAGQHSNGGRVTSGGRELREQWAVRRWESTIQGGVELKGQLAARNYPGRASDGNGVQGQILLNGQLLWSASIARADFTGVEFDLVANVTPGDSIDFVLVPGGGDDLVDASNFSATIAEAPLSIVADSRTYSAGTGPGLPAAVRSFNPDGTERASFRPFGDFTGGVRTAEADFDGDGTADIVVGTGPGRATRVVVLNGRTQAELFALDPFEPLFTGGVYVAAGDLDGDGVPELVVTPDEGGGPRVMVFSGTGFGLLANFYGIDDPNFRGGARAAIGDMNGDGFGDLIVSAGFGGGPRVAGFDGQTLLTTRTRLFGDFFAFEDTLRNGVYLGVGDLNGDGLSDLFTGGGPGGGPRVSVFDAQSLLNNRFNLIGNFFAGDVTSRGGVRLTLKNLDDDNRADLVVGSGEGAGSRVTAYLGATITPTGTPPVVLDFDAFAGSVGGVFVG